MKKLLITTAFISLLAAETINNPEILRVIDGDTFVVNIPNCNIKVLCNSLSIRVKGINTNEIRTTDLEEKALGLKAKAATKEYLDTSTTVKLTDCTRDKYFRLNCSVSNQNNTDLASYLIKLKLACSYNGAGTKCINK
jgi:endonuclease YncB( thermonuclease family)